MDILTISLPEAIKLDLERISRDKNKAVGDIVIESLRRYIAIEKFRSVRKKVLPFAEARGRLTDDDILSCS